MRRAVDVSVTSQRVATTSCAPALKRPRMALGAPVWGGRVRRMRLSRPDRDHQQRRRWCERRGWGTQRIGRPGRDARRRRHHPGRRCAGARTIPADLACRLPGLWRHGGGCGPRNSRRSELLGGGGSFGQARIRRVENRPIGGEGWLGRQSGCGPHWAPISGG